MLTLESASEDMRKRARSAETESVDKRPRIHSDERSSDNISELSSSKFSRENIGLLYPNNRIKPRLVDIMNVDVIRTQTTCHLGPKDYLMAMATSRFFHDRLYADRFNPNVALKRFVSNPIALRQVLRDCDALIAGSFVLQMISGLTWEDSDLDIFVWQSCAALHSYIISEGYTLTSKPASSGIVTYEAKATNGKVKVIQIIESESLTPIEYILEEAQMTATVNIMSADNIYYVFPQATFAEDKSYMLKARSQYNAQQICKYLDRGWKHENMISPNVHFQEEPGAIIHTQPATGEETCLSHSLLGVRRLGDKHCCVIELNTAGLEATMKEYTTPSRLELCEFSMTVKQNGPLQNFLKISYQITSAYNGLLEWGYTTAVRMTSPWTRIGDWLKFECMPDQLIAKLPKSEWARVGIRDCTTHISFDQGHPNSGVVFAVCSAQDLPSYDKHIPAMYAELEKNNVKKITRDLIETDLRERRR